MSTTPRVSAFAQRPGATRPTQTCPGNTATFHFASEITQLPGQTVRYSRTMCLLDTCIRLSVSLSLPLLLHLPLPSHVSLNLSVCFYVYVSLCLSLTRAISISTSISITIYSYLSLSFYLDPLDKPRQVVLLPPLFTRKVGARLSLFYDVWRRRRCSKWMCDVLEVGFRLQFSVPHDG